MPNFKSLFVFEQGVSFFYVLSGFILTYVYINSRDNLNWKGFFRARFARLYPLHIATLIAVILLLPSVQKTLPQNVAQIPLQLTLTQSWLGTYKTAFGFNGPAWSISTEFGFYLLFPLLLKFYKYIYQIFLATLLFTLAVIIAALNVGGELSYWLWEVLHLHPLGRLTEFVGGVCAAKAFLHRDISWSKRRFTLSEILIVLLIILLGSHSQEIFQLFGSLKGNLDLRAYFNRSGLFLLFCALIWVFAHAKGTLSQLLSYPIFILLGKISFAFYIIHLIVIRFFEQNSDLLLGYNPAIIFVFLLILSLGFSYAAYQLIELPFQKLILTRKTKTHISKPTLSAIKGGVAVTVLTLLIGCVVPVFKPGFQGAPDRIVSEFKSKAITADFRASNSNAVLTHYTFEKKSDGEFCYDMLWTFGASENAAAIERIVNIPYQERRRTVSHQVILPSGAWGEGDMGTKNVLDSFCFLTNGTNLKSSRRQLVRIMLRQKTNTGNSPILFNGGARNQNALLIDYKNPGELIWLKKPS